MRRTVKVGGKPVALQADDARLVDEATAFLQQNPSSTIEEFASWLDARGYAARVSIIPQPPER